MTHNNKHAVVILNYNNARDTLECLESVYAAYDTPHVILVDNASSDQSLKKIKSKFPKLDLIASPNNVGFAAGNNLGLKRAHQLGVEVIYLLNNDTIVDPNLFVDAYQAIKGRNTLMGAKIYYAKNYEYHPNQRGVGNIIWYGGGKINPQTLTAEHLGVDEQDCNIAIKPIATEFITGCFMAIPASVMSTLGYLDEKLFLYLEDLEYCLRAARQGIELTYNPNLLLYHKNSQTSGVGSPLVDYYMTRNRFFLAFRYTPLRFYLALHKEALTRNWNNPIRRRAYLDYLLGRMGNQNKTIARYFNNT